MHEPHKVTLVLDRSGVVRVKLVCPVGGCEAASYCPECGTDHCEHFPTDMDECWVKSWFDNCEGAELYGGVELDLAGRTLPIPIRCEWDGDALAWYVLGEPVIDPEEAAELQDGWA